MRVLRGTVAMIYALLFYVAIPYEVYSPDGLMQGAAMRVGYISGAPLTVHSGIMTVYIVSIGTAVAALAFLRASVEARRWKVAFTAAGTVAVLLYIMYFYLYGWSIISTSGVSVFVYYGGIFILVALTEIASSARAMAAIFEPARAAASSQG